MKNFREVPRCLNNGRYLEKQKKTKKKRIFFRSPLAHVAVLDDLAGTGRVRIDGPK